jgi:hypothetical protein
MLEAITPDPRLPSAMFAAGTPDPTLLPDTPTIALSSIDPTATLEAITSTGRLPVARLPGAIPLPTLLPDTPTIALSSTLPAATLLAITSVGKLPAAMFATVRSVKALPSPPNALLAFVAVMEPLKTDQLSNVFPPVHV